MHFRKKLFLMGLVCSLSIPGVVSAEGFGINEWSAEGVAMGGARMFAENDPANVAYNPASITKVKGMAWKTGAVYISPHGKYKAYDAEGVMIESGKNVVHPGVMPYFYYVDQIDEKQWFGIGTFTRFGMISEFGEDSIVATNAYSSELKGMSITPTYGWKPDTKVSAALGAEINYVGLQLQKKNLMLGDTNTEGDSVALGWNAALNYEFDDKNEIGLVYRSKITHTMDADFNSSGIAGGYPPLATQAHGKVVLPDSYSLGYNHKFDEKTRVELQGTYTRWSTYDKLLMTFDEYLPPSNDAKNWSNGWRYAIGVERKLSDKYTLMAGFAYDESSIPDEHADFMIPTGNRRTYSLGGQYHDKNQTVTLTLGHLDIGDKDISPKTGDQFASVHTHNNYAKVVAVGYERRF